MVERNKNTKNVVYFSLKGCKQYNDKIKLLEEKLKAVEQAPTKKALIVKVLLPNAKSVTSNNVGFC